MLAPASTTAIVILASPGNTVVIRNITINGVDDGGTGIYFLGSGGQLFLENVTIERFAFNAFSTQGASHASRLLAEINNCRFKSNLVGIQQNDNSVVAVRNSVITGTTHKGSPPNSFGVNMTPAAGTSASIKLENNEISYCQSGIRAIGTDVGGGTPELWATGNRIFGHTIAINLTNNVVYHTNNENRLYDSTILQQGGMSAPAQPW